LHDVESALFADDGYIFQSDKNLSHITKSVQDNLNKVSEWCDAWGFKISLKKTVAVVFTHRKVTDIDLTINSQLVKN